MDKLDILLIAYRRKKNKLRPSILTQLEKFCSSLLDLDKNNDLRRRDILNLSKGYRELVNQLLYGDQTGTFR